MKSLKRLRSVVLFFRNKNKTKQKSGRVSLRDAEKIFFSEKFYNDCHKSWLSCVIHREAYVMFLKFDKLINTETSAVFFFQMMVGMFCFILFP